MKIISAFKTVFGRPGYLILFFVSTVFVFVVANLLPNKEFVRYILESGFSAGEKERILFGLLGYFRYNSTLLSQILLIFISVLAGLDIALAAFYIKRKIVADRAAGFGLLGVLGGFFGVGCSACGSVILSSLIGVGATSQLVGVLPLRGLEFSVISISLLLVSIGYLAKKILDPMTCHIEVKN